VRVPPVVAPRAIVLPAAVPPARASRAPDALGLHPPPEWGGWRR
jgi:hypothetical protein